MSKDDLPFLFSQIFDDSTVWLTQCSFKYPKLSQKSFTYRILFLTSSCRKPNILLNSAGLPGLKTNIFFVSAVLSSRGTKIVVPVGLFSTIFKIMHKNLSHPKQITYNCQLKIFSKYDSIRSFYRCDAKQFLMCLTLLCK